MLRLICSTDSCDDQGVDIALDERIAILMFEPESYLPILLAPAAWARTKFPDNKRWAALWEESFKKTCPAP